MTEHFETRSKKGRGKARRSLDLIEAMRAEAKAAQPITGRGVGYKLFSAAVIPSMERAEMGPFRLTETNLNHDGSPPNRMCPSGGSSSDRKRSRPIRAFSATPHDGQRPCRTLAEDPGRTQPELRIPALQLKREWSPGPEFGWIPANLCDLSKG